MNEQELKANLRQQAFNVFGYAHSQDPEMVELMEQAQALHASIAQELEEINKKMQNYLALCMPDTLQCRLQLNQEKE